MRKWALCTYLNGEVSFDCCKYMGWVKKKNRESGLEITVLTSNMAIVYCLGRGIRVQVVFHHQIHGQ